MSCPYAAAVSPLSPRASQLPVARAYRSKHQDSFPPFEKGGRRASGGGI